MNREGAVNLLFQGYLLQVLQNLPSLRPVFAVQSGLEAFLFKILPPVLLLQGQVKAGAAPLCGVTVSGKKATPFHSPKT